MEVVRFFANYPEDLEVLAKYTREDPKGKASIVKLCKPLTAGLLDPGVDAIDILNRRFPELDRGMVEAGFIRIEPGDMNDYDESASRAFDVVFEMSDSTITILNQRIELVPGEEPPYKKVLVNKKTLGQIFH